MTAGSIAGFQGDTGASQNVKQIGVVVFKRDGKGDDIGIGYGPVRLHGGRPRCLRRAVLRQKSSFADNMIKAVEKPIDGLKPEIGHADMIAIGIHQDNADFSVPLFSNGSDLGFN